jgi:C4-dicarboxylate-specific signal transduction histidine kinase
LLDANGAITEWFGAAIDITARKHAEEALLRSEQLASLGRMAHTIAHEINNPLAALTNPVFLACKAKGLPPDARNYLEEADSELQRVAHITRQALGFYRESVAAAPVQTDTVIESTIDLFKGKISLKKAVLEKQLRTRQKVMAVAGELRQAFSNLLANSIEMRSKCTE